MQHDTALDPTGYDDRLFRLLLAEYVRRNFSEEARKELPDIRVAICSPFDAADPESDYYENRSIIVIPSNPLPRPHGPHEAEELPDPFQPSTPQEANHD